jgi:hypothetical protein
MAKKWFWKCARQDIGNHVAVDATSAFRQD